MEETLHQWIHRKLDRVWFTIKEPLSVIHEFNKHTGGKIHYASIELRALPAENFSFESEVDNWPDGYQSWKFCVLDGIMDVLFSRGFQPVLGATFTLKEIQWDPINSDGYSFYMCGREATMKVLNPKINMGNIDYRLLKR